VPRSRKPFKLATGNKFRILSSHGSLWGSVPACGGTATCSCTYIAFQRFQPWTQLRQLLSYIPTRYLRSLILNTTPPATFLSLTTFLVSLRIIPTSPRPPFRHQGLEILRCHAGGKIFSYVLPTISRPSFFSSVHVSLSIVPFGASPLPVCVNQLSRRPLLFQSQGRITSAHTKAQAGSTVVTEATIAELGRFL